MPYNIQLPDGRVVTGIPDEVTPEAAKARLMQEFPDLSKTGPVDKPATAGERSTLQYLKDLGLGFQAGFTQDIRSRVAGLAGADSSAATFLKDAAEHLEGLKSAVAKKNEQEVSRILESAKDKGVLDQVAAGAKAFGVDPGAILAAGAGSIPSAVGFNLLGKPVGAIAGAIQGAGIVKTAMYDAVKEELSKTNLPPDEIEKRALAAQDYFGKNPGMIAAGAGLGVLDGLLGLNKAITQTVMRRAVQNVGTEELEAIAKQGLTKTIAKGVAGEAPLEFAQGAQEQLASNVALQGAGVDTPTMRGVVSQGTLEGIAGGVLGGGFSPIQRAQARNQLAQRDAAVMAQEELQAAPPAGSTEEKVLALAAQLQARGMDEEASIMTAAQMVREEMDAAATKEAKPPEAVATEEEAPSATPTVTDTTGAGAAVPSAGGVAGVPTGGDTAPVAAGLDTAGATTQQPDVGAAVQPPALDETDRTKKRYSELTFATPEEAQSVLAGMPDKELKQVAETEQGFVIQDKAPLDVAADAIAQVIDNGIAAGKTRQEILAEVKTLNPEYLNLFNLNTVNDTLTQLGVKEDEEPAATTTEEPSVAETPEAKQAEEKGTETAAEVSDTPVDPDTKAATDSLKEATTAVDAAVQAREEDKATREKGKAEKPNLRKAQSDADAKLETAILGSKGTGESGMLNTLKELQGRVAKAELVLRTQVTRARTQPNMPETAKVEVDALMRPIEEALLQNRADLELGLLNLYEFASNPKYEGRPSHTKALEFLKSLDEPTKDRLLERSKKRLEAEAKLPTRKAPATVEENLAKQKEERAISRAEKKLEEETLARGEGTFKEAEQKPAVAVTTKKKRKIEIPPKVTPGAKSASRRKGLVASSETDKNLTLFSSIGRSPQSITKTLKYIQATGNEFEVALATRLLARDNIGSIEKTMFNVVDPNNTKELEFLGGFDTALGLYVLGPDEDAIYVRGPGFGEGDNGTNNVTVLHEALHATVNKRVLFAQAARLYDLPITPRLEEAYNLLEDLFDRSREALDAYMVELDENNKPIPTAIEELIQGDAFSDITEFVTYGMTDQDMQKFLRTRVPGVTTRTNSFSDFVNAVLKMLGLDEKHVSGLRDLIEYTDRIAASMEVDVDTANASLKYLRAAEELSDNNYLASASKKADNKAADIQERLKRHAASDSAGKIVEDLGSLSTVAKDPKLWGAWLSVQYKNMNVDGLNALLAVLPTNVVTEMGVNNGIVSLKDVDTNIRRMTTMRTKALLNVQEIANPWIQLSPTMQTRLSKVLLYATDARIDPDKSKGKDVILDGMWKQLDPDAIAVYRKVRDFYADNYALYRSLLNKAIEDSGAEGTVDDINTPKGRLAAAIKATYEVGASIEPYFPLMRFGDYWVSFGKGANREFHMFESAGLRDAFVEQRLKEIGEKRSFDKMVEDLDADFGNEQRTLQERLGDDNPTLKSVISLIDNTDFGDPEAKAFLKDKMYQMHLLMLPDASIRKQFIQRKGTAGFSNDALRAFITSGTRLSNQLARVRYGNDINNALGNAKASLKGNPDKGKLGAIVKEIELRAQDELNPPVDETFLDSLAHASNKIGFVYLLTGAKSALNQMFSLLNFSLVTLGTRHGWGKTLNEARKYMLLGYGQVGFYDKNGDWNPPSLGLSARVQSNKEEKAAYRVMQEMGISNMTQTYDLALRRGVPTANYNSTWNKTVGYMGALFHHSERLSREITFMTSFRLTYDQTKNFDKSIEQAVADTNEALFDYSSWNKPRAMRPAAVRAMVQFKQFPMFVTLYLWRNFYKMASFNSTAKERSEGAQMLLGTLGMTALMSGMSGLPYIIESTILATVQGLLNATRDEYDEEPLEEKNFKLWFYNVFLPDTFGESKIMGMKLSELITSGALNTATGYDVASGVSLNNLWFHDSPDANDWKGAFDQTLIGMLGPGVSVLRGFASGVTDFNNGDINKGIEKFLPAFFRGGATAYRYSEEGALTGNKAEIKAKDEFTATQLLAQTLGFKTTGLAQVMNNNFAVQQMVKKVKGERSNLLKQLDNAIETGSDDRIDEVLDKIDAFGDEYPAYVITGKEINQSMKAREKVRQQTERGLYLDKKSGELDILLERARRNIEEEAAK